MMGIGSRENETLDIFVRIYDDLLNSTPTKFNTFSAKRLSSKPQRLAIFLYLLGIVTTVLLATTVESMKADGINAIYMVVITGILALLVGIYIIIRKEKISRLNRYQKHRTKALFFEPEELWGTIHPQAGERGRLIKALLGARHIGRTVEETTTVPLSTEVMDTVISYLIKGITAAKDDDIHEHYIKETIHLCQEIHEYYSTYYPVIEIQNLLRYGEN
jgi:hypothetical protein